MLKKSKKIVFIFLITMSVFTLIFSACSGKLKKLSVVSLSSGKEYTLPLKASTVLSGGNFITFELEKSVAEIAETLKQKGYDCTAFNDNFILIKNKIDENKIDYLVIGKLSGQNRYQLMSAVVMTNNGNYYLFPIHLTAIKGSDLNAGDVYPFDSFGTIKISPFSVTLVDLKSFYTDAGIYNVEEEENSLKISAKEGASIHKLSKDTFYVSLRTYGEQTFIELKA